MWRWRCIARWDRLLWQTCLQLDAVCHNATIQEQSLGIHYNETNDLLDYLVNSKDIRLCRWIRFDSRTVRDWA